MQLNNLNIAVLGAGRSGRAAARLAGENRSGAFTILDIPPAYFTTLSREELLKHWM